MCKCNPIVRTPWCGKPGCETPPQPLREPTLDISLAGVHVDFPDGWWDDPSNEIISPRGRPMLEERIDGLALIIAGTLRQLLKERRPQASGLVDVNGRPVQPVRRRLQCADPKCAMELMPGEIVVWLQDEQGGKHAFHESCAAQPWPMSPCAPPAH